MSVSVLTVGIMVDEMRVFYEGNGWAGIGMEILWRGMDLYSYIFPWSYLLCFLTWTCWRDRWHDIDAFIDSVGLAGASVRRRCPGKGGRWRLLF